MSAETIARTVTDEILSIDPELYTTNAAIIDAAAHMGFIPEPVLDMTYGTGLFWTKHRPHALFRNDWNTTLNVDSHHDFRGLPAAWTAKFATTVLDPPYKLDGTPHTDGPAEANILYGVAAGDREYESVDDVVDLYLDGYLEARRVTAPKGYVLVKCMDQVAGSKTRWMSHILWRAAEEVGDRLATKFFLGGSRKQPNGRTQRNPRNNYSLLLVFQRGKA